MSTKLQILKKIYLFSLIALLFITGFCFSFLNSCNYGSEWPCTDIDSSMIHCDYYGFQKLDSQSYSWYNIEENQTISFTNDSGFTAYFKSGSNQLETVLKLYRGDNVSNDCGEIIDCDDSCHYERFSNTLKSNEIPYTFHFVLTNYLDLTGYWYPHWSKSALSNTPDILYVIINNILFPLIADTVLSPLNPDVDVTFYDLYKLRDTYFKDIIRAELEFNSYLKRFKGCYYSKEKGLIGFYTNTGELWLKD